MLGCDPEGRQGWREITHRRAGAVQSLKHSLGQIGVGHGRFLSGVVVKARLHDEAWRGQHGQVGRPTGAQQARAEQAEDLGLVDG
ncbi:hypothetical protein D3C87_1613020 [compost metagenome]